MDRLYLNSRLDFRKTLKALKEYMKLDFEPSYSMLKESGKTVCESDGSEYSDAGGWIEIDYSLGGSMAEGNLRKKAMPGIFETFVLEISEKYRGKTDLDALAERLEKSKKELGLKKGKAVLGRG